MDVTLPRHAPALYTAIKVPDYLVAPPGTAPQGVNLQNEGEHAWSLLPLASRLDRAPASAASRAKSEPGPPAPAANLAVLPLRACRLML